MEVKFSPPYMHQGLYNLETRRLIEAPNRATVAAIFQQREEQQREREWMMKRKQMHDSGIHSWGSCPWCPANVFYD